MIQLVFCLLCILQLNCDVLSLGVETPEQTKYGKVGGNAKVTYEITLDQKQSIDTVTILVAAGKISSTKSSNLAVITFKNGVANIQYSKSTDIQFIRDRISLEFVKDFELVLTISDITKEDFNWKFSCTASNIFKSSIKTVNLVEAVPPTISRSNIFHNNHTEFVALGRKNVKFLCEAKGLPTPTVTWNELNDQDKWKARGDGNVHLDFPVFTMKDQGGYRCTAENVGGTVQETFYIFPGYIKYEDDKGTSETLVLNIGETIRTYCPIKSGQDYQQNPDITYVWEKNGIIIQPDQRTLTHKITKLIDFTNYTCTASNNFGKLNYTVIVKNAGSVTPTAEGVNRNQMSSSNIHSGSAILVTLLHVLCTSILFMIF